MSCSDLTQNPGIPAKNPEFPLGYYVIIIEILAHSGRDKMADIFQTTFWNAFYWVKMYEFRLRFHLSLFL